jgi:hypothetical protein
LNEGYQREAILDIFAYGLSFCHDHVYEWAFLFLLAVVIMAIMASELGYKKIKSVKLDL